MNARKVAEDVGMSPTKLLELVEKLNKFGGLQTLTTCLEALVELSD
jgi:DNA-binding Lrp family transcriptional regulator